MAVPVTRRRLDDLDALEERGAAELRRRVAEAEPVRLRRNELDGHVALSRSELYELGCTVRPLGLAGIPSALAGRLQVVAGALLASAGLAGALVPTLTPILGLLGEVFRDPDPTETEAGFAAAGMFLAAAAGGLALLRRGVRRLRRQAELRRRAAPAEAFDPSDDPLARTTVAVLRDVDELRVQLLWMRGDPEDPAYVETRVLAERRVEGEDRYGAEDAVLELLDVAARADAARGLGIGTAAAGPGEATSGRALVAGAERRGAAPVDPSKPIADGWAPEPLTDEGAAELASRLVLARPVRWSAASLAPLVVDPAHLSDREPRPWPASRSRTGPGAPRVAPRLRRWLRGVAGTALGVWILAASSTKDAGDHTVARWIAYPALALGAGLLLGMWWRERRDPGARLLSSVRAAAASVAPRALERGLSGPAGRVLVLRGSRSGADRFELVHVRPAPADGQRGDVEVRTLAWRRVGPGDAIGPRTLALELWRVADDAGFVLERRERTARALRRLAVTLGRRAAPSATGLAREPLVWLAATVPVLLVVAAVRHTFGLSDGGWLEHGLANRILSFAWPLLAGWLLVRSARRFRDPYAEPPPPQLKPG